MNYTVLVFLDLLRYRYLLDLDGYENVSPVAFLGGSKNCGGRVSPL
jgi:hypothetical protein